MPGVGRAGAGLSRSVLGGSRWCNSFFFRPEFRQRLCLKSALSGKNFIEHEAKRIDVAAHRSAFACELLRRHIGRRARNVGFRRFLSLRHRQPKIGNTYASAPVDHYIGRLQIAMQHSLVVRRRQSRTQLFGHIERLCPVQAADSFEQRCQIFTVDVFHREKVAAVKFADVVNPADIGVRNLPCNPHFRKQPLAFHGIIRERLGQEFQRHRLSELEIVSPIHLSHSSAAYQPDDSVSVGQHHARREPTDRQGIGRDKASDRSGHRSGCSRRCSRCL
jgi:hypothetical protein